MLYILAALPIFIVLVLMIGFHWGGQKAGPVGWLACLAAAVLAFGLPLQGVLISQVKGVFLSLFVLAVLWPALYLYNLVQQAGGIQAMAEALENLLCDRGLLLVVLAFAFSAVLEGVAGFGMPVAVVAPMLVNLGISPIIAVAAVAVGHSWSVTFGDMGVIFQSLVAVVKMEPSQLASTSALVLGLACLVCGFASAALLKQQMRWLPVLVIGALMGLVQYLLAVAGLMPLAALGAGLCGVTGGILWSKLFLRRTEASGPLRMTPALAAALGSYGSLTFLMSLITLIPPLHRAFNNLIWQMQFPEVVTGRGFMTPAGGGQAFRPLVHPGTAIFLVALLSYLVYRRVGMLKQGEWKRAAASTWRAAAPASLGILATVGLSAMMDHAGMTLLLAHGLSTLMGGSFPLVSPLVGILGAFATGSNTNSNVLFGPLQKNAALLLAIDPRVLVSTQTAGGSLGSMLAPAKLIVGCSTVGLKGRDGEVLRLTLPIGLGIGLLVGIAGLLLAR